MRRQRILIIFYYITADRATLPESLQLLNEAAAGGPITQAPCSRTLSSAIVTATVLVDPRGKPTTSRFNGQGYLIQVTDALGHVTTYERQDGTNLLLSITDPLDRVTRFQYDGNGNVTSLTDALNHTRAFTYEATFNQVRSGVDPLGNTQRRATGATRSLAPLRSRGRPSPLQGAPQRLGPPRGPYREGRAAAPPRTLPRTVRSRGRCRVSYAPHSVTTFEYDAQGNLTAITDPEQNTRPEAERLKTRLTYNLSGQPLTVTDPLGHLTSFSYDSHGNLASLTDPLNRTTSRFYDLASRLTAETDPLGRLTQFGYDALNHLTGIEDALGGTTSLTYDANGNLLTVTDPRGNTTRYTYDSMDRLSRRSDPLGRAETFGYDGNGNLVSATDRKTQTTTFTYDPLNRRTQASYPDGAIATFTYDDAGRLTQADDTADPHRPITLTYDPLDRPLTETTSLGTVGYAYDTAGRRTTMTVSGQAPVSYTYDHNSRLRTITQAPLNPVDLQYDAMNRRTLLTLPNGVSTEYQYDLASQLTALIYRNAPGLLGDLTYQYDPAGNRISVGGSFARTLLPDAVTTSAYDAGNRQLAFGASSMSFDDNGNLLNQTDPSGTITYTWDARNQLTAMAGPTLNATFAYDGLGRRARKTISSLLTQFQYDGLDIVREVGGAGDAIYLRTLGIDEALTRTDAADTVHFLADALGSTVDLSNPTGASTTTYTYEPYGRTAVIGGTLNPLQYTGREYDGTGLYYYRARYYDPRRGQFLSEDPIGLLSGTANLYGYVTNNPHRFRDPYGLGVWDTVLRWAMTRPLSWFYSRRVVQDNLKEGAGIERDWELERFRRDFAKCLENADKRPPSTSKSSDEEKDQHLSWEECIEAWNRDYPQILKNYPSKTNWPKNYFWSSSP